LTAKVRSPPYNVPVGRFTLPRLTAVAT
jgi:hypothetical protein